MKRHSNRANIRARALLHAAVAACLCTAFLTAQSGGITTTDPKAKEMLDTALQALGGADKIGDIKSLIVKGKATSWAFSLKTGSQGTKAYSSTSDIEIRILLPDNFIEINRFPERTVYYGISQGKLLPPGTTTVVRLNNGRVQAITQDADIAERNQAISVNARADQWSRLLTGTLVKAGPVPLTLSSGSTSGVFTLTKMDGDLGEVEFDSKTGYPLLVRTGGSRPANTSFPQFKSDYTSPSSFSSIGMAYDREIRFSDRFSVNGVMFPRIITTTGWMIDIEWRIVDVQINPILSMKDFEVPEQ